MTDISLLQLAIDNKDVFWSLLLVFVFVVVFIPLMIRQQNINKKLQEDLNKSIVEELKSGLNRISVAVWKSTAEDTESNIIILDWAITKSNTKIISFIKKRLIQNDIHKDSDTIKRQIRADFDQNMHQFCFSVCNKFVTEVWLLWDIVEWQYDALKETILDEVFSEFFKKDTTIDKKVEVIYKTILKSNSVVVLHNIRSLLNKN